MPYRDDNDFDNRIWKLGCRVQKLEGRKMPKIPKMPSIDWEDPGVLIGLSVVVAFLVIAFGFTLDFFRDQAADERCGVACGTVNMELFVVDSGRCNCVGAERMGRFDLGYENFTETRILE